MALTEAQVREIVNAILEEFTHRLDYRYASRTEIKDVEDTQHTQALDIGVLETEMRGMRSALETLGGKIEKATWAILTGMASVIAAAVLNVVLN